MKSVTWELTLDMPESYNLEAVADNIKKLIERNSKYMLPHVRIAGFYLIKETLEGEVIR